MNNSVQFANEGYCIVKNAISDELRDFISQYALFDELQNFLPERDQGWSQVPNAHSKYADPAMETMLLHVKKIVESNTGLDLFPTYSFYRVYRPGDDLKQHIDRESCEISATLCFNYSYEKQNFVWPIFMNDKAVVQDPGDMVIYRGCDLPHHRESFNFDDEAWHIQGFFHYVDANGPNAEFKFDKRDSLGIKKNSNNHYSNKSYITYTGR